MADWYLGSVQYAAVTTRANTTAYNIGDLRRPVTPAADSERVFRCTTAGTSAGSPPAAFSDGSIAVGGTLADGTVTWTEVTGNSTYAWSAPHAKIRNALARTAAGDTVYCAGNHAETQSTTLTITPTGTIASPQRVICVNAAGSVPPVSADLQTTATVTTTSNIPLVFASGCCYFYGITFSASNGVTGHNLIIAPTADAANCVYEFKSCVLKNGSTGTIAGVVFGVGTGTINNGQTFRVILDNTTYNIGAVGQAIIVGLVDLIWKNTPSALSGLAPTNLFVSSSVSGAFSNVYMDGVDLSAMGAGKTIVGSIACGTKVSLVNCQLNASVTVASQPTTPGSKADLIVCDSAGNTDRQERYTYSGTLTRESTIIRDGGASDGVAGMSWKIVTTANAKPFSMLAFECFPTGRFNEALGSPLTATVHMVNDGSTLTNDDVWMEVVTLDASGNPQGTFHSSAKADPLAAASNLTASSETWAGTGGFGSAVKQKMSVTFTPLLAGMVRVNIYVGKASKTLYIDPKVEIA